MLSAITQDPSLCLNSKYSAPLYKANRQRVAVERRTLFSGDGEGERVSSRPSPGQQHSLPSYLGHILAGRNPPVHFTFTNPEKVPPMPLSLQGKMTKPEGAQHPIPPTLHTREGRHARSRPPHLGSIIPARDLRLCVRNEP